MELADILAENAVLDCTDVTSSIAAEHAARYASPSAVSRMSLVVRLNSLKPSRCSRRATVFPTEDLVSPSRSAASVKLPARAAVTKTVTPEKGS